MWIKERLANSSWFCYSLRLWYLFFFLSPLEAYRKYFRQVYENIYSSWFIGVFLCLWKALVLLWLVQLRITQVSSMLFQGSVDFFLSVTFYPHGILISTLHGGSHPYRFWQLLGSPWMLSPMSHRSKWPPGFQMPTFPFEGGGIQSTVGN